MQRPRLANGYRCTDGDVETIRSSISRGIIGHALKENQTTNTISAATDERFAGLDSVKQNQIHAVLCAPIGSDPALGVIYLQGRSKPGAFTQRDNDRVDIFAKVLAPLATRIVGRRCVRDALVKHDCVARLAYLDRDRYWFRRERCGFLGGSYVAVWS